MNSSRMTNFNFFFNFFSLNTGGRKFALESSPLNPHTKFAFAGGSSISTVSATTTYSTVRSKIHFRA